MNQRWRERRHTFRPDEPIDPARYKVIEIEDDATARGFVERHHYSATVTDMHAGALKLAAKTELPISDEARRLNRARAR